MSWIKNNPWKAALLGLFVALVAVRMALPSIILGKMNETLADYSPVYRMHVADFDMSLLRMSYTLQGLTADTRADGNRFLNVESVTVDVAWRELFRGRVLADVLVNGAVVQLTNALFSTAGKGEPEDDAKSAVDQLIPVRVARVAVRGSTLRYADLVGAPELKQWQINELESLIINITPSERAPDTTFTATGTLLNSAKVKAAGKLLLLETPARWDIDAEVRRFDLAKANPLLKNYVPLTFGSGQLDLFTEAKSDHDGLVGYIKPYLTGLDVVGDRGDFVGGKHLIFEMLGATGNLILRRGKENSVATKIEFSKKGQEFKWNIGKAVALALEHGFADKLSANAEDRIELK